MSRRLPALLPVLPLAVLGAAVPLLLTAAVTAGDAGAAAPAAAPVGTAGKTYVALGDSYAAGFGLPAGEGTPTGEPVPGCAQTTGDYPHLLAATLGLTLTDVTCSDATTTEFSSPQSTTAGTAPAQLDVFDTVQPDLVTITIGGNDLGFCSIAADCLTASADGPLFLHQSFASCTDYFSSTGAGGGAAFDPYDKLPAVLAKVDAAVAAVQAAAPDAKIAVIAYPAIAPDAANTPAQGCYAANALVPPQPLPPPFGISVGSAFTFADADTDFLQQLQQQLDDGIGDLAAARGVAYADIYPSSLAHSACEPEASRWVEPLLPGDPAGSNVLHPNLAGTTAMADALAPVVEALFAPAPSPSASATPTTSPSPTGDGSSTAAGGGTVPLADTGPDAPVGWFVGAGLALIAAGVLSLRLARWSGRHAGT